MSYNEGIRAVLGVEYLSKFGFTNPNIMIVLLLFSFSLFIIHNAPPFAVLTSAERWAASFLWAFQMEKR